MLPNDSPRRSSRGIAVPAVVPPQVVSDRSALDSALGFISDVTLTGHQSHSDPKDTIIWARFESAADISDPCFGEDWELEGNVAPPLLLVLGYGLGVQVWAIPANGEAVEVLSWRHGTVSTLRILPTPSCSVTIDERDNVNEAVDLYADKRPLIALVDSTTSTAASQPQFCTINYISLKTGQQVKAIKFKNPVLDILANRSSIVVTFHERIAIFDAHTLDDRVSVTTCFPSPGINPNPVALGSRWLAYAEQKLIPSKRSGGGWDGEGIASYTATVLNAAKSFGRGLREFGEQVAAGITGASTSAAASKSSSFDFGTGNEARAPGVVTIMDTKYSTKEYSPTSKIPTSSNYLGSDPIVAHFIAHSEAIVSLDFDNSGMLLVTADRRGHDFHVFRIQPHPMGPSLAAVHHLYILHRGDTSSKVQNVAFTLDSRWVAVSTLRGTTHVFPITPYGGPMGVRTHTSLHVVNKLSRFHRSAGLSAEGRSNSPISHSDSTTFVQPLQPYYNATLPPFPRPTLVFALAQIRQPFALSSPPGSAGLGLSGKIGTAAGTSNTSQRQRHSSLSDDNGKPLSVCAIFAKSRSWMLEPPNTTREAPHRMQRRAVDSLFVMAGHGALIQYDLDTKLSSYAANQKICDDTAIELEIEAKAQWNLGRRKDGSQEIMPPLTPDNWLIKNRNSCVLADSTRHFDEVEDDEDNWLSKVEIVTHAGPHRRLWMGPQFVFKTYNTPSGANLNHVDKEAVEIGLSKPPSAAAAIRSNPLAMPGALPVFIESGSIEHSPKFMDRFRHEHLDSDFAIEHGDSRIKQDLAEAMRESPLVAALQQRESGRLSSEGASSDCVPFYDARADYDLDDDESDHDEPTVASFLTFSNMAADPASDSSNFLPTNSEPETGGGVSRPKPKLPKPPKPIVEKVVNSFGTVTTVTAGTSIEVKTDILDEVVSQLSAEEGVIHENCDEALFRPVVAIFCDEKSREAAKKEAARVNEEFCKPPEEIGNKLIVPVIAKEVNAALCKKEKQQKSGAKLKQQQQQQQQRQVEKEVVNIKEIDKTKEPKLLDELELRDKKTPETSVTTAKSSKQQPEQNEEEKTAKPEQKCTDKMKPNKAKAFAELLRESQIEDDTSISEKTTDAIKATKATDRQSDKSLDKTINTKPIAIHKENVKSNEAKMKNTTEETPPTKNETELPISKGTAEPSKIVRSNEIVEEKKIEPEKTQKEVNSEKSPKKQQTVIKDSPKKTQENKSKKSPKKENIIPQDNEADYKPIEFKRMTPSAPEKPKRQQTHEIDSIKINKDKTATTQSEKHVKDTKLTQNETCLKTDIKSPQKETKGEKVFEHSAASEQTSVTQNQCDKNKDKDKKKSKEIEIDALKPLEPVELYTSPSEVSYTVTVVTSETKHAITSERAQKSKSVDNRNDSTIVEKKSSAISDELVNSLLEFQSEIDMYECTNQKAIKDGNAGFKAKNDKSDSPRSPKKVQLEDTVKQKPKSGKKSPTANVEDDHKLGKTTPEKVTTDTGAKNKLEQVTIRANPNGDETKVTTVTDVGTPLKSDIEQVNENKGSMQVCTVSLPNEGPWPSFTARNKSQNILKMIEDDLKEYYWLPASYDRKKFLAQITASLPQKLDYKTGIYFDALKRCLTTDKRERVELNLGGESVLVAAARSMVNIVDKENEIMVLCDGEMMGIKCIRKESVAKKSAVEPVAKVCAENDFASLDEETVGVGTQGKFVKWLNEKTSDLVLLSKVQPELKKSPQKSPKKQEKKNKKCFTSTASFDDFPALQPLEALPPLPDLEPLDTISVTTFPKAKDCKGSADNSEQLSLINFESPPQESPSLERKITPLPRGFSEQNLIFALCGSLHYENEGGKSLPVTDSSSTLSLRRSSSVLGEQATADLKSLAETDDQYLSLEQSSQETNTTNTATTNEKFSSSANSSASEEIVVVEEKKMTKKQRRKRQQIELKKEREAAATTATSTSTATVTAATHDEDEELRPLICMTDSQLEPMSMEEKVNTSVANVNVAEELLVDTDFMSQSTRTTATKASPPGHSTTTDSEGPLPATTSDDNIFVFTSTITSNKLKTKKLDHKINLIAAIEAATSSSTSSAEESSVEAGSGTGARDTGSDQDVPPLVTVGSASTSPQSTLFNIGLASTSGATKKKTKKRKR